MLQIGTRNMSNFDLLVEVGKSGHPVLLKRGRDATVEEWLLAAEYVLAQGNMNVVLCERGVRGFDPATRNLLDLAAVRRRARAVAPARDRRSEPRDGRGRRTSRPWRGPPCAAGADGVMVEVHVPPRGGAAATRPRRCRPRRSPTSPPTSARCRGPPPRAGRLAAAEGREPPPHRGGTLWGIRFRGGSRGSRAEGAPPRRPTSPR